ncbi:hypothetical protein NKR19_g3198 [Coniochaeta hoffmannii]|uniref:Uncharacterized protein n=1 Tax=Coniochaeta hoffmannii TaxID=91930 RepID=A0AA38S9C2_9PEZI|nr:hypothetical protein NKR19_g3198 [Coniochaeta hoffmannii]
MYYHPFVAVGVFLYHMYTKEKGYKDFFRRYPYCRQHKRAVILLDHIPYVLDPYTWLTIANDDWLTRNDSSPPKQD